MGCVMEVREGWMQMYCPSRRSPGHAPLLHPIRGSEEMGPRQEVPVHDILQRLSKKISHEGTLGNERGETYCMISSENDQTPE